MTPYGIRRVTTADGTLLYQHEDDETRVLVQPWVAAQMTDLLQGVVDHGTGRAAALGRPTAGKTGTTTSNKDGWFVGFSSGITTGVWMGRDDAKSIPSLHGGTAPARAFAAYMKYAVRNRPVEQFNTELKLPEWQLEPDDEQMYGNPDDYYYIDEAGNLVEPQRPNGDSGPGTPPTDPFPVQGEQGTAGPAAPGGRRPSDDGTQAASDDFLSRATGNGPAPAPTPTQRPRAPAPQPTATQRPQL